MTKQKIIGKVCSGGEQQGKGAQENCSATGSALRVYSSRVSFRVVSGHLTQGPSGMPLHLSSKADPSRETSGRGQKRAESTNLPEPFALESILTERGTGRQHHVPFQDLLL